jgi:hypothetical protein
VPLAPSGGADAAMHKTKGPMRTSRATTHRGGHRGESGQAARCLDLEDGGVRPEGERHRGSSDNGGADMARSCGQAGQEGDGWTRRIRVEPSGASAVQVGTTLRPRDTATPGPELKSSTPPTRVAACPPTGRPLPGLGSNLSTPTVCRTVFFRCPSALANGGRYGSPAAGDTRRARRQDHPRPFALRWPCRPKGIG